MRVVEEIDRVEIEKRAGQIRVGGADHPRATSTLAKNSNAPVIFTFSRSRRFHAAGNLFQARTIRRSDETTEQNFD